MATINYTWNPLSNAAIVNNVVTAGVLSGMSRQCQRFVARATPLLSPQRD